MIEIRGPATDVALRRRIVLRLGRALAHLGGQPVTAAVALMDDNGPKGGPAARCALTVQLPHRPSLRVERTAVSFRAAFNNAAASLQRQLGRDRERQRERRRHPKKYYTAKRLLAPQ